MDKVRHLVRLAWLLLLAPAASILSSGCGGGTAGTSTAICTPACPAGTTCTSSGCVATSPPVLPDGGGADLGVPCGGQCGGNTPYCNGTQCVPCLTDDQCPKGSLCKQAGSGALCVPGCKDDARCGGALRCCGGQCIDTSADASNCGACGTTCMAAHAAASCSGSACVAGTCDPGYADCNKNLADGCETHVAVDPKNCNACGVSCTIANAIAGCGNGCYIAACQFGFDDCNGNIADGCEVSVLSDIKNCGACGQGCINPPHARDACVNAACQLAACDPGFLDCNGNVGDGCEINSLIDNKNCGACGNGCGNGLVCKAGGCTCPQCNFPNASSKCLNLVCVLDKCLPGFGDCNMDPKDGCEVPLSFDAMNCGACGNVCGGQTPYCIDGVCSEINNSVFIVYSSQYHADVKTMLDKTGAFKLVDEFNAGAGTPTAMQMQTYGAVLVYSDSGFQNASMLGDALADYYDNGGSVVVAVFANASVPLKGRFGQVNNGYMLIQPGNQEQPNDSLGKINEPNSPLVKDVMKITATSAYRSTGGAINGATVVAEWNSGKPMVVRGVVGKRNMVSLNFYPPSNGARQDFVTGDVANLLRNALLYR